MYLSVEPRVKSVLSDSKYMALATILYSVLVVSRVVHRVLEDTLEIFLLRFHPINEYGSSSWAVWVQILTLPLS